MPSAWLYILVVGVSFIRVYARAAQQLNVLGYRWKRIPFYSYLMSVPDVVLWGSTANFVVKGQFWSAVLVAFLYGTAGWLATYIAMYFHPKVTDVSE